MFAFEQFSSQALIPEHLVDYVQAVSPSKVQLVAGCLSYYTAPNLVVIAYPLRGEKINYSKLLQDVKAIKGLSQATILSPEPLDLPVLLADNYWYLQLPCPPRPQKLRNSIQRAHQEVKIVLDSWGQAHADLVKFYLGTRSLSSGTIYIWQNLAKIFSCSGMYLYSAYRGQELQAFCIGNLASFTTGFYLFAYRHQNCPPGTADALLAAFIAKATDLGLSQVNLGLGINPKLEFFKQKWQAVPQAHYEYLWQRQSWWKKWL